MSRFFWYKFFIFSFLVSLCIGYSKPFAFSFIGNNIASGANVFPVYVSDVLFLILGLMFFDVFRQHIKKVSVSWSFLIIFLLFFIITIIPRGNTIFFYYYIREIEALFCFCIFFHVQIKSFIPRVISILGVLESILGIVQFHLKHSVAGLYDFGQPHFDQFTYGIAKVVLPNGERYVRAYGTFTHPNSLGAFLLISIAMALYLIFTRNKMFDYISLFILIVGMTVTFSRAGYLGLGIMLVGVYFTLLWKKIAPQKTISLAVATIILAGLISLISYHAFLSTRATISDSDTADRIFSDHVGVAITKKYPLFGGGLGSISYLVPSVVPQDTPEWLIVPPHNYLLLVSSETGLISLAVFLCFLGIIFWQFCKGFKKFSGVGDKPEFVILFWLFVSIFVIMQFDHYFYDQPLMRLLFWAILGIIAGAAFRNTQPEDRGPMVQW